MDTAKQVLQWRAPTQQITQRVGSYISNNLDYPDGFGLLNPHHCHSHKKLHKATGLKNIQWLRQSHSSRPCYCPTANFTPADACWTNRSYLACAVLTADCLPVFFVDADATIVAVAHAGWRGLAAGILENTLSCFPKQIKRSNIHAAFGPAITQPNYEVGEELIQAFPANKQAFKPAKSKGKYLLSLYDLAKDILEKNDIASPVIPKWCTLASTADSTHDTAKYLFPSHRRDKDAKSRAKQNARTANLIWLK